jgi:hypothetical protein
MKKLLPFLLCFFALCFAPHSRACTTQPEPIGGAGNQGSPYTGAISKLHVASLTSWGVTFRSTSGVETSGTIDFGAGSAMGFSGPGWDATVSDPAITYIAVFAAPPSGVSIWINHVADRIKTVSSAGLFGSAHAFSGNVTGLFGFYDVNGSTSIRWYGLNAGTFAHQDWLAGNGCHNAAAGFFDEPAEPKTWRTSP